MADVTKEPQYARNIELRDTLGLERMGLVINQNWYDDPRRVLFIFSRYKFVGKMLCGMGHVLEVGCGDGTGSRLVLQEVDAITAIDFDPVFVNDVKARMTERWAFDCRVHYMLTGPATKRDGSLFDAAYSIDVIEHISKQNEEIFVSNISKSLKDDGVFIVGSPSLESQPWASPPSKAGHVNCMTGADLKSLCQRFFANVFLFSMNDEVVHTGFSPMAHYLIALCVAPRRSQR